MATFYHFTSVDALERIRQSGEPLKPRRPMIKLRNVFPGFPEKCADTGIFGLPEQEPSAWHKPLPFPSYKESLLETVLMDIPTYRTIDPNRGGALYGDMIALLEVTPVDSSDIYVADWGTHFDPEYNGPRDSSDDVSRRVKKAYAESLVPIDEKEKWAGYIVPEVICFKPVDQKDIKLVDVWDCFAYVNKIRAGQGMGPAGEWQFRNKGEFRYDVFSQIREKYGLAT